MKASIITIGDELLLGQTINTNLARIGNRLSEVGIYVVRSITIRDDREMIINTLDSFLEGMDLVIITGGLGPTNDDITKETLTEYFGTELELNEKVLENVKGIFARRNRPILDINVQQAMVPKEATILHNPLGTAPGMWFTQKNEEKEKHIISLPGVPYELEGLLDNEVLPRLIEKHQLNGIYYQTVMTQGIGESFLAEKIKVWEDRLYADGLHLAYLPSPGLIRLRVTSSNGKVDQEKIETYIKELENRIPQYAYGRNEENIFEVVGELLRKEKATLGTIESCTGGGLANSFVLNPGSSDYFQGGLLTYSNYLKEKLADVPTELLETYGAVSEEVAIAMAKGGKSRLEVDYSVAITGIAGPDGGTPEKPVGLVWIAVSTPTRTIAKSFLFGDDRGRNLTQSQVSAANMLRLAILEED